MIMHDIPKKESKKRHKFQDDLQNLGYQVIQKSIWVSPYNILDDTKKLLDKYKFQDFVKLLLVEENEI